MPMNKQDLGQMAVAFLDDIASTEDDGAGGELVFDNAIITVAYRRLDSEGQTVGGGVAFRSSRSLTWLNEGLLRGTLRMVTKEAGHDE